MEGGAYPKAWVGRSKEASTDETHKEVQTLILSGGYLPDLCDTPTPRRRIVVGGYMVIEAKDLAQSFQTTERDLADTFSQHGPVEAVAIITDRETGRSKGFGFVTMTEGADKAIAQLSGSELNDRMLTVNEAKPMVKRDFGGSGRGGNSRGRY